MMPSDAVRQDSWLATQLEELTEAEFAEIRQLIYTQFGIHLTAEKRTLVVGRLQKHVRSQGFTSFSAYLESIKQDTTGESLKILVEKISTNHTFFFREDDHFEYLSQTVLPQLVEACDRNHSRDLRIWSAGCSSGEEPYGLLILMKEFFGESYAQWDAGVLATDISTRVLEAAKLGIYDDKKLERVPAVLRQRYFERLADGRWQVSEALRREATFRHFNLMNDFPFKKPFDVIFCRNVMIYFDAPTRDALVQRFFQQLKPGGYLFIGHSESLSHGTSAFRYVRPSLYRKPGGL